MHVAFTHTWTYISLSHTHLLYLAVLQLNEYVYKKIKLIKY